MDYSFSALNTKDVLINRLHLLIRQKMKIEGKINDSGFDILYSTNESKNLLKIIELKGNFSQKENELII